MVHNPRDDADPGEGQVPAREGQMLTCCAVPHRRQNLALVVGLAFVLLFDFVLFLVLLHAHNRDWLDIFLY